MKPLINFSQALESCLEIHCGADQGTGFLISENTILTAYHVIADHSEDQKIFIKISTGIIACEVLNVSIDLDLCLLTCNGLNIASLPLESSIIRLWEPCQIHGFPYRSSHSILSLNGKISQPLKDDASDFTINELDIDPNYDHDGLSGAPVIIEGKVAGIVRRQLDDRLSMVSVSKASQFFEDNGIEIDVNLPAYDVPHGFEEQVATSRPNRAVIANLEEALQSSNSWFLIHGSPGSGKSTLSASFSPSLKTMVVACRYFLKIPNDSEPLALRRSKVYFLEYLENMIATTITGQRLPKEELSFEQRLVRMGDLLEQFAAYHLTKGQTVCMIIDGLDEVPSLEEFLGVLPQNIPVGIKIILSSTSPQILPSSYRNLVSDEQQILVTPLTMAQCEGLIIEELGQELLSVDAVQSVAQKSEGHPLYLRYLINFLHNSDPTFFGNQFDEWLTKIPVIQGDITNYYNSIWDRFYEDPAKLWIIIIFSQVRQPISQEEAYQILPQTFQLTFTSNFVSIKYLFYGENYLEIYHNSFKTYVASRTTKEEPLANDYISGFLAANPELDLSLNNLLYHYSKSSNKSIAVEQCNQKWADLCAMNDVAPDLVLDDIRQIISLSINLKMTIDTIRLLLLLQRIDFRYDSVFTEYANLMAQALLAVKKYEAAVKYLVRDNDLLIGNYDAIFFLQQFYEREAYHEANMLYEALEKRYRKFIEEGSRSEEGMSLGMFGVMIKANALSMNEDFKSGYFKCTSLLSMLRKMENSARDAGDSHAADALYELREQNSSWMYAYALRRFDFFVASEKVKQQTGLDIDDGWANLRALAVLIFDEFNEYNSEIKEKSNNFELLINDLESLVNNFGYWESHSEAITTALLNNSKNAVLVRQILERQIKQDQKPFNLRASNGVDLQYAEIYSLLFRWLCSGYNDTTENFPQLSTEPYRHKNWEGYATSLLKNLAYIEGRLLWCRATGSSPASAAQQLLKAFTAINFSLDERSYWDRAYHLPENLFPILYCKSFEIAINLAPEIFEQLFSVLMSRMDTQLGLYSEGFRKVLHGICKILIKEKYTVELEDLIKIWESHVIGSVYNRWERTPELLKIMEIYGLAGKNDKANAVFAEMLKTSMGPSWYKEDQLALIGRVMSLPDQGSVLGTDLKAMAGLLDFASGEMTFQRYVRQEKEHFIGGLIKNGRLKNALDYYRFEVLADAIQVIENAEYDAIDAPIVGNGYILGAGNLTEERAILEILENSQIESPQLVWALAQVFIVNTDTDRYIERYTTLQAEAFERLVEKNPDSIKLLLPYTANTGAKLHAEGHANYYLTTIFDALDHLNKLELQALLRSKEIEYNIEVQKEEKPEKSYYRDESENPIKQFVKEAVRLKDQPKQRIQLLQQGTNAFMDKKYMIWHGNYSGENTDARGIIKSLFNSADEAISSLQPFIEEFDEIPWIVVSQLLWFLQDKFSPEHTQRLYGSVSEHFTELIQPHPQRMQKYSWIEDPSNATEDTDGQIASFLIWLLNHPADRISEGAYRSITLLCQTDPELIIPVLIRQSLSGKPLHSTERSSFILYEATTSQHVMIAEFRTIDHFTIRYNFFRIGIIMKDLGNSQFYNEIIAGIPVAVAPTAEIDLDEEFLESVEWNISRLNEKHLLDRTFCERLLGTINQCVAPLSVTEFIKSDGYVHRSFYEGTNGPTRFEYIVKHALNIAINHRVSLANIDEIFDEIDI